MVRRSAMPLEAGEMRGCGGAAVYRRDPRAARKDGPENGCSWTPRCDAIAAGRRARGNPSAAPRAGGSYPASYRRSRERRGRTGRRPADDGTSVAVPDGCPARGTEAPTPLELPTAGRTGVGVHIGAAERAEVEVVPARQRLAAPGACRPRVGTGRH